LTVYCLDSDIDNIKKLKHTFGYSESHRIYQKELYEIVGFSNGFNPGEDIRVTGLLGPVLFI